MTAPGRNAKGHILNDDDTTVQAMNELDMAIDDILDAVRAQFPSAESGSKLNSAEAHLQRYREIRDQIDVGRKPKKEKPT